MWRCPLLRAVQQSIDISCLAGPEPAVAVAAVGACWDRQTDRQTHGRPTDMLRNYAGISNRNSF